MLQSNLSYVLVFRLSCCTGNALQLFRIKRCIERTHSQRTSAHKEIDKHIGVVDWYLVRKIAVEESASCESYTELRSVIDPLQSSGLPHVITIQQLYRLSVVAESKMISLLLLGLGGLRFTACFSGHNFSNSYFK